MTERPRGAGDRGARAHYEDAAYYDQAYRRRRHDVAFYVQLAKKHGGPVLELGAGSGRVSLAIAKEGIEVVGVELVPQMLGRARDRLGKMPRAARARASFRRGDVRSIRLRRRFPLVIAPFNVFMHLYTRKDVERALKTVRAHLAEGGRFGFDVLLPDPASLARDPKRGYSGGKVPHPSTGERYRYREYFAYEAATQVQSITLDFEHPTRRGKSFAVPLTQRQFFPQELEALLHYNGFRVLRHEGDFEGVPLTADAESQLILARLR